MNVEQDGHLCLHMCDLLTDAGKEHARDGKTPLVVEFSFEARIAAAYANRAGYPVTFVCPGQGVRPIEPEGYFLPVRKVKSPLSAKPVPKSAVGKRVGDFPSKTVYRKVQGLDSPSRWVVASRETCIENCDVWG